MLRIGSMNMRCTASRTRTSATGLAGEDHGGDADRYSLVLANPPFAGSLDYETRPRTCSRSSRQEDRAAVHRAVPAPAEARRPRRRHRARRRAVRLVQGAQGIRRMLVEDQKLDGVVKLPSGVFRPMPACRPPSCCSPRPTPAAPTMSGSTTCQADGFRLDDKRTPLLPDESWARRRAPLLRGRARKEQPARHRWRAGPERDGAERERAAHAQSFCVPKADIAAAGYDLSINRYKEVVHEEVEHRPPKEIIAELKRLEEEIGSRRFWTRRTRCVGSAKMR
jgi:type I restriction enzyme M protein